MKYKIEYVKDPYGQEVWYILEKHSGFWKWLNGEWQYWGEPFRQGFCSLERAQATIDWLMGENIVRKVMDYPIEEVE